LLLRLAVFTSQFPGRVNTFFARDMRALIEFGIEVEVFPLYPLDESLWRFVPDILDESVLPREKVHHFGTAQSLLLAGQTPPKKLKGVLRHIGSASASALKFGLTQFSKTQYAILKAFAFAKRYPNHFDQILSYWGNYAATCALFYNKLLSKPLPFSIFLHAGTDLYRDQIYLREKLLHADNIIVVCDFNKRFINKLYPDAFDIISPKIYLHHLGLELSKFDFKPEDRPDHKVLAVGRLDKRKGFKYLLRAASHLNERGIRIEIEMIGDGPERRYLDHLSTELGLRDCVKFHGWREFDDVKNFMAKATVLVHPSSGLGDAVPTVIKEAMALGLPVIASDAVGIPELLDFGKCGMLVSPKDSLAIAESIDKLLKNKELRLKMAHAAREFAELKFDMWKNGKQLADVLTKGQDD
jgi:glycosyltransferase involved in cell wall biosynthesis